MKISKKLLDNIQRFENVINYKFKNKLIEFLEKENIKYYYTDDDFIDRGSIIFN